MTLVELAENYRKLGKGFAYTDKNTVHSYLPVYDFLLSPLKNSAKNVLEIGVLEGGSIRLWHDYFNNATIFGLDIKNTIKIPDILSKKRIKLNLNQNAYNINFINKYFSNIKFDFLIDDGPHTLDSMICFIRNYLPLLQNDGVLIIEDIQDISWTKQLISEVPDSLKKYIEIYDLRQIKNRADDILFVINKLSINDAPTIRKVKI